MLSIHTYTLGALDTNCYLIADQDTGHALLFDPAEDGDFLSNEIIAHNYTLTAIMLTHGHCDHVLGLLPVTLNFPDTPVYLHPADLFLIERAQESAQHWFGYSPDPVPLPTHTLSEGQVVRLGEHAFSVIETPGHTPGSCAFYCADNTPPLLVCGDTVFARGVGRSDFSYSRPLQLQKSIEKLTNYPASTHCLSGHGADFLLSERVD